MAITRRTFLKSGAQAAVGAAAFPGILRRAALEAETAGRRLVVILQRGAADGLNIVVPHGEPAYYALRPTIAVGRDEHLDLDGFFGLHPAMAPLHPLFRQKRLAIVHAAGSPHPTRSHFEAQDYMESGTPGSRATQDGWLNRSLRGPRSQPGGDSLRAVALGPTLPRILSGGEAAVALSGFGGSGGGSAPAYPSGRFADSLRRLAWLIKANLGIQVAFAETGGWDHHANAGGSQGLLAGVLREFSHAVAAFWTDLGDLAEDTVIVTMSEFGRTARENHNRGTDHGHANVMFILGGRVNGGRVYGRWPGLEPRQLHQGRNLAVTTDFRQVLGELVCRQLGNPRLDEVFPGFDNAEKNFLHLLA